jgi:HAD superfamily hydrolase (TIGR01509 family)
MRGQAGSGMGRVDKIRRAVIVHVGVSPTNMQPPELVIFDCDGVLVDSEPISNAVLARALTEAGLPTSTEEAISTYKGRLLSEVAERAEAKLGRPLPAGFIADYEREREAEFRRSLRPVPGAAVAVQAVSDAGVAVCVASQGKLEKTELTLTLTGLRGLFGPEALFSAYSVPRGKPYPDLYLHAAETMGTPPALSVVVEDTTIGVKGALAAGMHVFGFAPEGDGQPLSALGADVLASLIELPAAIGL